MTRKRRIRKGKDVGAIVDAQCCSCVRGNLEEYEDKIRPAVEESMRRFLKANRKNIRASSKTQIASESYSGGMVDMIGVIRNALGKWAVEQLLIELERWHGLEASWETSQVRISVAAGTEMADVSPEDAMELGEQIVKWIEERKGKGKKQAKDPMFG